MRKTIMTCAAWLCLLPAVAQDSLDDEFEQFLKEANEEFDNFRDRCNSEYADFLKRAWEEQTASGAVSRPKEEEVPPVVVPDDDDGSASQSSKRIDIEQVVKMPRPEERPKPLSPIAEQDGPPVGEKTVDFRFFGTDGRVRFDTSGRLRLKSAKESDIAEAWKVMSGKEYNNLVYDCLKLRDDHALCDWAYLSMLKKMADAVCGKGTNEATLLMAYVYCQSGYRMRLARDGQNVLHMMYASRHVIYDLPNYRIDDVTYYPFGPCPERLYICKAAFEKEQSMSLLIPQEQKLAMAPTEAVTRQSLRYPEIRVEVTGNRNLMDFYTTYPTSMIDDDMMTRWAMYANVPMSGSVKEQLYPVLRRAIEDCDQLTAVSKLLNFIQTGFEYEYDDKVWGHDRAFFAEESLYYKYCDCEDRAILLTRLVRDLVGLRCILVYYPGHLSSAVEFTEGKVSGDYIMVDGRRFVIADGTFIGGGAPVGRTMTNCDNKTAKVMVLE